MVNYWYAARPNEIFLDLDSRIAVSRAFSVLRRALKDSPYGRSWRRVLPVERVYFYSSESKWHMILVLRWGIGEITKAEWALWMGSDRLRVAYVLERFQHGVTAPDLLRASTPYFRMHDAECQCKGKHKPNVITGKCPALKKLLGSQAAADYFPRNTDRKKRGSMFVSYGRVSLEAIKVWRDSNGREEGLLLGDGTVRGNREGNRKLVE